MNTELLYLSDPALRRASAKVLGVVMEGGYGLILDRTPAYPRGGGQPSDLGSVRGGTGEMRIQQVTRNDRGEVVHLGAVEAGSFAAGDVVEVEIDGSAREAASRLHTAGELICAALADIDPTWRVGAASHVPGQARVAFLLDRPIADLEALKADLASRLEVLIRADHPVETHMADAAAELASLCPAEAGKAFPSWPVRMVSPKPGFWRPCLGAHCQHTAQVRGIELRRVRIKGRELSISYTVEGVS